MFVNDGITTVTSKEWTTKKNRIRIKKQPWCNAPQ